MSTVFVHVGQCGNQLGQTFWREAADWHTAPKPRVPLSSGSRSTPSGRFKISSKICDKASSNSAASCSVSASSSLPYSLLDGTLPCVLVDTETKVIGKCTGEKTLLGKRVPPDFRVVERGGRGNNWAYGYFGAKSKEIESEKQIGGFKFGGLTERESLIDTVLERVRRLVEKCDRFGGFVQLHSVAGGTGSGVGSAIVEQLREDYPLSYILSIAVAPFSRGETPLQNYNSLLCLQRLQTHTDAVILFQNDHILAQAQKSFHRPLKPGLGGSQSAAVALGRSASAGGGGGSISVDDMNTHMSNALCNVLLPVWSASQKLPSLSGGEVWELIRSLCPDPGTKFILPSHCQLTTTTHSWDNAFSAVTGAFRATVTSTIAETGVSDPQAVSTHTTNTKLPASAVVAICRANPSIMTSLVSNTSSIEKRLRQAYHTVQWNPFPVDFWLSHEPHLRDRKVVSVLANSAAVGGYLQCVKERARRMLHERAYLHWFERYGCEQAMFEEAFETVERIVENYRAMK